MLTIDFAMLCPAPDPGNSVIALFTPSNTCMCICGVAVKFGGVFAFALPDGDNGLPADPLLVPVAGPGLPAPAARRWEVLLTRYTRWVMDMLDCGDHITDVHLLLLSAERAGLIVSAIPADNSSSPLVLAAAAAAPSVCSPPPSVAAS